MSKQIAIVEDEPGIRENYRLYLERQGYRVATYGARAEAERELRPRLPDLVILDIGLGDEAEGGFELCRRLRARSETLPIIFLTARDSDLDAVSGLRLGADDYLTKDIALPHLGARIAALFRRLEALSRPAEAQRQIRRHRLLLDQDRLSAEWDGALVDLTVTEFWFVCALAERPGHVRTRGQLMEAAGIFVDGASISTHVKRIRRKFQEQDPGFDAIETVYGAGYRWRPEPGR